MGGGGLGLAGPPSADPRPTDPPPTDPPAGDGRGPGRSEVTDAAFRDAVARLATAASPVLPPAADRVLDPPVVVPEVVVPTLVRVRTTSGLDAAALDAARAADAGPTRPRSAGSNGSGRRRFPKHGVR